MTGGLGDARGSGCNCSAVQFNADTAAVISGASGDGSATLLEEVGVDTVGPPARLGSWALGAFLHVLLCMVPHIIAKQEIGGVRGAVKTKKGGG